MTLPKQISLFTEDKSTYLAEGSPASHTAQPENDLERKMTATSGRRCLGRFEKLNQRYVVGENVRGLLSWNGGLVFDEVQSDLEAEGYEVLPFLLPACAVNAPHRRDRIWFIAYAGARAKEKAINGNGFGQTLGELANRQLLPTPQAADGFKGTKGSAQNSLHREFQTGRSSQLNPRFVAEMMGFPPNWTELPFQNRPSNESDKSLRKRNSATGSLSDFQSNRRNTIINHTITRGSRCAGPPLISR
jgi:site-specific DNA-cytosine methylase